MREQEIGVWGGGILADEMGCVGSEFQDRILLRPPISRLINCLQNGQDGANAWVALYGSPQTQSYSRVRFLLALCVLFEWSELILSYGQSHGGYYAVAKRN